MIVPSTIQQQAYELVEYERTMIWGSNRFETTAECATRLLLNDAWADFMLVFPDDEGFAADMRNALRNVINETGLYGEILGKG